MRDEELRDALRRNFERVHDLLDRIQRIEDEIRGIGGSALTGEQAASEQHSEAVTDEEITSVGESVKPWHVLTDPDDTTEDE